MLSGHVGTFPEQDAVLDAAWRATGVCDLIDDLPITGWPLRMSAASARIGLVCRRREPLPAQTGAGPGHAPARSHSPVKRTQVKK